MNEWQELGRGDGGLNDRNWVADTAKRLGEAFMEQIKKLVDAPVQFCWRR